MTMTQDLEPRWTAEAIERLRELAVVNVSADLLSAAMHRPATEIRRKAAEIGLMLDIDGRAN